MKRQEKLINKMFKKLELQLGEYNAGLLLSIICDLLDKFVEGVDQRELRTLELVLNNFYSAKYDFVNNQIIK